MEPFYFGTKPSHSLFGVYHPPRTVTTFNAGIILCYPIGQEYIRSYRTFLRLAALLSSTGFHTLRFDYYGCGDSSGDFTQASVSQWIADIATAIDELKGGCGSDHLFLIGLRLGGSLSAMAGSVRNDIHGMVLWDPVISGRSFIEEMTLTHSKWLRGTFAKPQARRRKEEKREFLGFPYTDRLLQGVAKIDLFSLKPKPAKNLLILESTEGAEAGQLCEQWQKRGASASYACVPSPKVWVKNNDELNKGLVPIQLLHFIVDWLSRSVA